MGLMFDNVGRLTARYLQKPAERSEPFTPSNFDGRHMSGNTNMRPTGYRSRFGTTAKTAWEYWNIYCFAVAIGFHWLAKDALDAHFRVVEQELEGSPQPPRASPTS